MGRFFPAMAYAGRLYVQGLPDKGPWDAKLLIYWEEAQVDAVLNPFIGDRKAQTVKELRAAIEASRRRTPAIEVWIAESLKDEIATIWQGS
jgi:hypothetical protein